MLQSKLDSIGAMPIACTTAPLRLAGRKRQCFCTCCCAVEDAFACMAPAGERSTA